MIPGQHSDSLLYAGYRVPETEWITARPQKDWIRRGRIWLHHMYWSVRPFLGVCRNLNVLLISAFNAGNSGPLPAPVVEAIESGDLVASGVLSGNRNFEGK